MRRFLLLALLCSSPAWACDAPTAPAIPDGASSTKDQMVQGQGAVKAYVAAGNEYLTCVDKLITAAEDPEEKKRLNGEYNKVVDEMQAISTQFNESVKAFKAKGS